ncbi:WS/DGAT domain-containing protein [Gordonia sp. CPCC 206044]|uniref:WS/DGAT domain-containing protein n=1 Tax=Gordonia sp. CPCC 206044 TaxID=3140793 RepID=UPI003AF38C55
MIRMAPADARSYWMADAIPNDQFLVYCFADQGIPLTELAAHLRARAAGVDDLCLRIVDVPASLDLPHWVGTTVRDDQVVVEASITGWGDCLDRLGALQAEQLDPRESAWRIRIFGPVVDAPRGPAVVVVLQICHALGDGRRTSSIARALFADDVAPPRRPRVDRIPADVLALGAAVRGAVVLPVRIGRMLRRGFDAYREVRRHPPTAGAGYPPTVLNRRPGPARTLRVIVGDRAMVPSRHPVTVGALTAISLALDEYLPAETPIGAELTIGRSAGSLSRNNFRNAGIDLHTEIDDVGLRADTIAEEVARARAVDDEPARRAERRATDATPAVLARWGIRQFDADVSPPTVTGVTVVSSVHRGPADLWLGGGEVLFTTGFPALSPAQGLTHGVHGIGGALAISVTTSPEVMPDVDRYVTLLRRALDQVSSVPASQSSPGP